ncbi:multidrug resistance related protein 1, putative [Brugia malayi]|uniref:ABC-type glutathione-S-conjugate transporter n=1 Tax=Brugia malayi TaxID=6279 RepID=A0A0H5SCP0_BRUMA|nr:multidrug resistance related protein 1, putative [Brugia malayi]CRZ25861.1 Bm4528, isoform a [Brugia malayi]VIO86163.1 multidrug resistance related protein 1, putative [Brugia malayi]
MDYLARILCDVDEIQVFDYSLNSTVPHITNCAESSILVITPLIFLIIFSPLILYDLKKSRHPPLELYSPTVARIILCFLLVMNRLTATIINLITWFRTPLTYQPYSIMSCCWQTVTYCVCLLLLIAYRNRGLVTSGVLFNFWLLTAICAFPELRRRAAYAEDFTGIQDKNEVSVKYVLYIIYYAFILFEVFLSCFADKPRYWLKDEKLCPEDNCSYLNKITFNWFHSLAARGFRRPLEVNDLWRLRLHEESENLMKKFKRYWLPAVNAYYKKKRAAEQSISLKKLSPKTQPSLLWALAKTYRWTILSGAAMKFVFDVLNFVSPQLLSALISYIEDMKRPLWMGIAISFAMFAVALVQSMILHQYFHKMFMLGINVRSVLTNSVYVKALMLSNSARKNRTVGEIVNLMSVDVQRFQDIASFIMLFWSAPFQILLAIYFLWRLLGIAVVAGLTVLFATIPLTSYISLRMKNCQGRQMKLRDERLKFMSEILNGIRIIKFYAWEKSMQKLVLEIREKEIAVLREIALYNAAISLTWSCAPFLVAVVTFGLYVKIDPQHNQLTPQVTFVGLSLFNLIRFPMTIFPLIFSQGTQCSVSNTRLKSFLSDDEMQLSVVDRISSGDYALSIQSGNFSWDNNKVTLNNINLKIKKGELVAIVGKVGSGKSSLLSAVLGEMDKLNGNVDVVGSIAYAPQQPWIQNLSLMDNILFGTPFDPQRYETVLDACALKPDLATLPAGDQTEIGEKGINLSGGQKHRVSLARAVYANSDIILLDDPLSAVDAHVGRHTFTRVISSQTGLLAKKTRILVTHGLHYLKYCDRIVVMNDGKITEVGTFQELVQAQKHFAEFLEDFLMNKVKQCKQAQDEGDSEEMEELLKDLQVLNPEQRKHLESFSGTRQHTDSTLTVASSIKHISSRDNLPAEQQDGTTEQDVAAKKIDSNLIKIEIGEKADGIALSAQTANKPAIASNDERSKLIEKEGVEVGKVKFAVYLLYLHAIGYGTTAVFVSIYIFSSVLGVSSNLWLANWSDHANKGNITAEENDTNWRLGIYATLGLGQAAMVCTGSITMAYGMVFASRKLHEGILRNIMHLPMAFFDITPLGRIVNRFGKDIEIVDALLPHTSHSFISTVLVVLMTTAVILYATPMYSVIIPFLAAIYFLVLRFYISTSRQLKRLESTARSPIYSHFQESIQGSASIRAYRCMNRFIHESQDRLDKNIVIQYHSLVANRWLAVRLELVGNLIVFCSALFAVFYRESGSVTAGLVGLSVAYALSITQTLNWAVRMASELETNVVAVERLREYTDLPTEGLASENLAHTPRRDWPSKGEIIFEKLKIRYRDNLEFVLKGISATIHPAEKIGIVGRTGAGKSSLTLALFRIIEADSGRILIDGEDISKISLDNLRSKLTIVPQDPVVFSGTLRMNLDPFGHFDDALLWNALRTAHLDSLVHSFPNKLEHKLSEGGENISVGQRQLLCLARAVLRMSQILILDEAAASVDMETDALIQKTIRERFSHCTVLTIAHRLHTVMDSDRILVLENGYIREFDTPRKLLDDPDSLFRAMMKESGLLPTKEH